MTGPVLKAARQVSRFVWNLWRAATAPLLRFFPTNVTVRLVEGAFPKKLKKETLYVLTEDGLPWQAAMVCPCGCKTTLELNLLPDERPLWRYTADSKGRATLKPSVRRKVGCKSHFILRDGKINWV